MGASLVFSILAMVTSCIIEQLRKEKAIDEGFFNDSPAVVKMSVMWLVPQQLFHRLSEALNIIGRMEFYYSEFAKSMSRVATSLYLLGAGIGSLLSSLVLRSVNVITKQDGKESWVSTNINMGHYDNDYWLLAINELCKIFLLCGFLMTKKLVEGYEKKEPIHWTPGMDVLFINAMLKEKANGNRPEGTFIPQALNSEKQNELETRINCMSYFLKIEPRVLLLKLAKEEKKIKS
nr:At1G52190-like protein [Tanacetum cinerariifolium]